MEKYKAISVGANSYSALTRIYDLLIIYLAFYLVTLTYDVPFNEPYVLAVSLVFTFFVLLAEAFGLYRRWFVKKLKVMVLVLVSVILLSFIGLLMVAFFLKISDSYSRVGLSLWFAYALAGLVVSRLFHSHCKRQLVKSGYLTRRAAIVGATPAGEHLAEQCDLYPELGFKCVGFYDDRLPERLPEELRAKVLDDVDHCVEQAKRGEIEVLFLALPMEAQERIKSIVNQLGDTTVDVHLIPDFLLSNLMHARVDRIGDMDTLSVFESPYHGAKMLAKRAEDLFLACAILLLVSPLMLAISVAIKLTSRGPVFFKQDRYGLGGEKIQVWKFRTMKVMENGDKVVQAGKNDPRVTPLGRFLRRTSLDELPQFFNVILGEMSVVGPRPHAVSHNEEYRRKVAFYMLRHKVKPGITGWAQVNGWRGETDTVEKMIKRVEYDLQYIRHWSVLLDFKIILLTIVRGFVDKNAY